MQDLPAGIHVKDTEIQIRNTFSCGTIMKYVHKNIKATQWAI